MTLLVILLFALWHPPRAEGYLPLQPRRDPAWTPSSSFLWQAPPPSLSPSTAGRSSPRPSPPTGEGTRLAASAGSPAATTSPPFASGRRRRRRREREEGGDGDGDGEDRQGGSRRRSRRSTDDRTAAPPPRRVSSQAKSAGTRRCHPDQTERSRDRSSVADHGVGDSNSERPVAAAREEDDGADAVTTTARCNAALAAYAKAAANSAFFRDKKRWAGAAVDLLERMRSGDRSGDDGSGDSGRGEPNAAPPDVYSYCMAISALSKVGDVASAQTAQSLLRTMRTEEEEDHGLFPDRAVCNAVLAAWANLPTERGARAAEDLLNEMERKGTDMPRPDEIGYHTVIAAWTRACSRRSLTPAPRGRGRGHGGGGGGGYRTGPARAEALLGRMLDADLTPSVVAFGSVVDAWSKSGCPDAHARSLSLLQKMDAWDVKPNVVVYTAVLSSLARNRTVTAATTAEELLSTMESEADTGRNVEARPNAISYGSVIDAWCRTGSARAGERTERLLGQMATRGVEVNAVCCQRVIAAWLCSVGKNAPKQKARGMNERKRSFVNAAKDGGSYRDRECIRRAEAVLSCMENGTPLIVSTTDDSGKNQDGAAVHAPTIPVTLPSPTTLCYNPVMHACSRVRSPLTAQSVLDRMDVYTSSLAASGAPDSQWVLPDEHTFNSLLYALSVSDLDDKHDRAYAILRRMEDGHRADSTGGRGANAWGVRPRTGSYNLVVNACATIPSLSPRRGLPRSRGAALADYDRSPDSSGVPEKREKNTDEVVTKRRRALSMALEVFARLSASPYCDLDGYSYVAILKAIGKLLPAPATALDPDSSFSRLHERGDTNRVMMSPADERRSLAAAYYFMGAADGFGDDVHFQRNARMALGLPFRRGGDGSDIAPAAADELSSPTHLDAAPALRVESVADEFRRQSPRG